MVCTFRFSVKIIPPILDAASMCFYLCAVYWEILSNVTPQKQCISLEDACHQRCSFWQRLPKSVWSSCKRFMQADNLFDTGCQSTTKCLVTTELCWDGCCELEVKLLCNHPSVFQQTDKKAQSAQEWARRYFFSVKKYFSGNVSASFLHHFCKNISWENTSWHFPKLFHRAAVGEVEVNENEE